MADIKEYIVGDVIFTANSSFNPMSEYGGTWTKLPAGILGTSDGSEELATLIDGEPHNHRVRAKFFINTSTNMPVIIQGEASGFYDYENSTYNEWEFEEELTSTVKAVQTTTTSLMVQPATSTATTGEGYIYPDNCDRVLLVGWVKTA